MKRILDVTGDASVSKEWATAWFAMPTAKRMEWFGDRVEKMLLRAWKRPLPPEWEGRLHIIVEAEEPDDHTP